MLNFGTHVVGRYYYCSCQIQSKSNNKYKKVNNNNNDKKVVDRNPFSGKTTQKVTSDGPILQVYKPNLT